MEAAAKRLSAALDGLEAALERRQEVDGREHALADQVAALGVDRSRLASQLDEQTARATQLGAATREVSRRLDMAMDAVRAVVSGKTG
ncbi:hypothetical protein GJW-30_1_02596 [Variibacter gotjawalensis]|uniref:DUF4164 family protein n=2 Tax=Variibacter gotjawalensis TaxID=1333996 RepID=A0A0S3PVV3_9BRAD|nr:DUF4164 domain-containing protein [Variibacter gotjawalensis]BAT60061.1 hypothetical protein GJW-30_1_02596 [Variibacter gotjawalensis]